MSSRLHFRMHIRILGTKHIGSSAELSCCLQTHGIKQSLFRDLIACRRNALKPLRWSWMGGVMKITAT